MSKRSLWKRLAAVAASATMLISMMGSTVMALPDTSKEASITVHKYSRTSETSADNTNHTGEEIQDTSGLGTPLAGAGFTLYEIDLPALTGSENYTGDYTVDVAAGTVTFTTTTGTQVVPFGTEHAEQKTNASGETKFEPLVQGYYVLVETTTPGGDETYEASAPSVISLPLTNSAGNDYNYDIHVYPKNVSKLPITKNLDEPDKTYEIGDTVKFTIEAGISNNEAGADKVNNGLDLKDGTNYGVMKIKDTLVSGLTYGSSELYLLRADNTSEVLTLGTDYTIEGDTTGELVWTLTDEGMNKAADANNPGVSVQVKLTTTVNASSEALSNKASSYVKKAGSNNEPGEPETPDVKVPTGKVDILKVNGADDTALEGAIFAIAKDAAGTTFLTADGNTVTITNQADLLANTDIIKATTDTNGKAIISGLPYDTTTGTTYYLVEVQAPAGFQLKEAAITAELAAGTAEGEDAAVSVEVKNYENGTVDPENPKFSLPLTGGTGTVLFTVIGVLIMATVAVIYIRSKRKQNA